MFARVKKSGKYQYLQIVENRKEAGKVRQRVIATIGRLDQLQDKDKIEPLVRSLSRFSERVLMILSEKQELVGANSRKIGPTLVLERIWNQCGLPKIFNSLLAGRKFEFDVERAIFLTVLHRLMVSGSDRWCNRWRRDYLIEGTEALDLHHLYRAMAFLGQPVEDPKEPEAFSPRCIKDLIEEDLFSMHRDLFSSLDLVFFDTTSIYFEGHGGTQLGKRGHSKDHRPDLKQMVVGAIIDSNGRPICCEMWPGNTADVATLIPVTDRIRQRFGVGNFCIVADRGMISAQTIKELEARGINYILGARMRKVNDIRYEVLSRPGSYCEVYPEGHPKNDPAPLKVKEVKHKGKRYIVCVNSRQARKDAHDRETIVAKLEGKINGGSTQLIGNKGYRKYLKLAKGGLSIDDAKIKKEARFDGKWVLTTNTQLDSAQVALKYKELWQVERLFRDVKSLLDTRPIFHQRDDTIRGHVFCSFLALVLRKELDRRLQAAGHRFEWAEIKQDLKALEQVEIQDNDKHLAIRTQTKGCCGKIFQAVGVALPPTIREIGK